MTESIVDLGRLRQMVVRYGIAWQTFEIDPATVMALIEIAEAAKAHLDRTKCHDAPLESALALVRFKDAS